MRQKPKPHLTLILRFQIPGEKEDPAVSGGLASWGIWQPTVILAFSAGPTSLLSVPREQPPQFCFGRDFARPPPVMRCRIRPVRSPLAAVLVLDPIRREILVAATIPSTAARALGMNS